jgi:hypothetical protein
MKRAIALALLATTAVAQSYRGFDKNDYPGDTQMLQLRRTFEWTGYWLSNPPGMNTNPWRGKRDLLRHLHYGFALLYLARSSRELKESDPKKLGAGDALAAAEHAAMEYFGKGSVIFLDLEEGGRLLPEQKSYVFAWADRLKKEGFTPGVYCSGIPVPDGPGTTVTTAQDILESEGERKIRLWVAQDSCPPSPGCSVAEGLAVAQSGSAGAMIWQYAQTPRRPQFAVACASTYAADDRCYAPQTQVFVDLDIASKGDPSQPVMDTSTVTGDKHVHSKR